MERAKHRGWKTALARGDSSLGIRSRPVPELRGSGNARGLEECVGAPPGLAADEPSEVGAARGEDAIEHGGGAGP